MWLPGVSLTQEEHGHRMTDWRWMGRYKSVPVCDTLSACLISCTSDSILSFGIPPLHGKYILYTGDYTMAILFNLSRESS